MRDRLDLLRAAVDEWGAAYVYDLDAIRRRLVRMREALGQSTRLLYAIKANPLSAIVLAVDPLVNGYEVASYGEWEYLRALGVDSSRIVFGGPAKTREEVEQTIGQGLGAIHVESLDELGWAQDAKSASRSDTVVALRINTLH